MLIVTQNREAIVNMENVFLLSEDQSSDTDNKGYRITAYDTGDGLFTLGTYPTKERAMQVLRLIAFCKSESFWMPPAEEVSGDV